MSAPTRLEIHEAAQELSRRFPGHAFALFVFANEPGELTRYVSNAPREQVVAAFRDMINANGLTAIPSRQPLN
jgi:hypothetical protein